MNNNCAKQIGQKGGKNYGSQEEGCFFLFFRLPTQFISAVLTSIIVNGLLMKSFIPALIHISRSVLDADAVRAMM